MGKALGLYPFSFATKNAKLESRGDAGDIKKHAVFILYVVSLHMM